MSTATQGAIQRFVTGRRVLVLRNADGIALRALGTVGRIRRCDTGAWIELDQRSKVVKVHPFPEEDSRGRHVLAYPEDCELPMETSKDRRRAKRATAPVVRFATFARDHWSTFLYIETCVVDHGGAVVRDRMRCDPKRHPLMAHSVSLGGVTPSTRLKDNVYLHEHDDWDCADDLEDAGLVEYTGAGMSPRFALTDAGWRVATELRRHKAAGGAVQDFVPSEGL